jgi:MoaA/NifB/PqqE/SkfB family radical SAM enzyme
VFELATKRRIGTGILLKSNPLYVQFYVTARCNLTCQQCNIIYANSDLKECTLAEVEKIAENLGRIGVAIVLLTGGEPFLRKDLPDIIRAFVANGIHVRMQTNGLASEEAFVRCVEAGGRDISISLDTVRAGLQDEINGGFPGSWERAIKTIAMVTRYLPPEDSFAAFGCVLTPLNIEDVEDVVSFGTRIGWYTSLVPIHVTLASAPMNFRTYDQRIDFRPEHVARAAALLARLREMKREGALLYDSDEYLEDIRRFAAHEPIHWRRRHGNLCDSPGLYFAILPDGRFAVCCDHRLPGSAVPAYAPDFPQVFRSGAFRERVERVARACPGCMFGSYPEITITARYWSATFERIRVFAGRAPRRSWPLSELQLKEIARDVLASREGRRRPSGRIPATAARA